MTSEQRESAGSSRARSEDLPGGVVGDAAREHTPVEGSPLRWIMTAIFAWGVILAMGVVWYDYEAGNINFWKPVVILVAVSLFVWGWSWAARASMSRRRATQAK